MIISEAGLFAGNRIGHCSDEAQMHWPRLMLMSNGFGRFELNANSIIRKAYASFSVKPTPAQLSAWIREYQENFLLFVYRAPNGALWGQWMTPDKALKRFKTQADRDSPIPDEHAVLAYQRAYAETLRADSLEITSFDGISETCGNLHKISEDSQSLPNASEDSGKFRLGVGVGVGEGIGKSKDLNTSAHREKRAERVVVSNDPPPPSKKQARALALKPAAEECHAAYPRKVAKEDSLRAFTKHIAQVADSRRISDADAAAWMLERVRAYAASPSVAGTPLDKIPYPASWANAGRYDDPADAWQVTAGPQLVHQARDRPYEPGFDNAQALQDDPRIAEQRANVERWRAEYRLARDEGRPVPEWALRDLEIADAELVAAKGVQVH